MFETSSGHYFNEATKITHRPLLLPDLVIPEDHSKGKLKPLELQDIPLDKLQAVHRQATDIQPIEMIHNTTVHAMTIPLYMVIIICLCALAAYRSRKYLKKRKSARPTRTVRPPLAKNNRKQFFSSENTFSSLSLLAFLSAQCPVRGFLRDASNIEFSSSYYLLL
ncbi:hypothetical protein JTB14_033468 [Gonioctena quinquepunctata]|nr:hypothetical protein JTB14_033468 [Gonioctena quinquepunctata]